VRVLLQRVQYPFVNPDYSFVGLTGDAGINMAPDSLIPHLQREIWSLLVMENPVVQFLPHSLPPRMTVFLCLRINTGLK